MKDERLTRDWPDPDIKTMNDNVSMMALLRFIGLVTFCYCSKQNSQAPHSMSKKIRDRDRLVPL